MTRRQDRFGYSVTIPPTTARVVDTAVEILGDPDPDAKVELVDGGPLLKRSPPPIRYKEDRALSGPGR